MNGQLPAESPGRPPRKRRRRDRNRNADPNSITRGKPVSEKWKPVWGWLQSLGRTDVVEASEIIAWLDSNPEYAASIRAQHTNGVLVAYVQKCHQRLLFGRNYKAEDRKVKGDGVQLRPQPIERPSERRQTNDVRLPNGRFGPKMDKEALEGHQNLYQLPWSEQLAKNVAPLAIASKYEGDGDEASVLDAETWRDQWRSLLDIRKPDTEVEPDPEGKVEQSQGPSLYSKRIKRPPSWFSSDGPDKVTLTDKENGSSQEPMEKMDTLTRYELILNLEMRLKDTLSRCKGQTHESYSLSKAEKPKHGGRNSRQNSGRKSRGADAAVNAWAYSEASIDLSVGNGNVAPSVVKSLADREKGANSETVAYRPEEIGNRGKRWKTVLNGWDSLEKQRLGPTNWLQKRAYSSWVPSWCAYTSSIAIAQPLGSARMDQGIQKVLDVRFHPGGDPQLVVSCNEPPNELLLYNLESGRAKELIGHNTQIQAVEFAVRGDSIVSCASNIVKVWDSSTGACLHTLGPGSDDGTVGHKKKISAMTVNQLQPCLAATSGGEGDNQLLLWNILSGELASDLNAGYRQEQADLLSMDALNFCSERYLLCGSDSRVVNQQSSRFGTLMPYPTCQHSLHTTLLIRVYVVQYITCLETNACGSTVITGAGDGSVGLFDVRSAGSIARLPLSSTWEVTSVSFSACDTYFQASCTGNCTFIWDTRMMPLEVGPKCVDLPPPLAQGKTFRALHHLSHGDPMPTSENSFQVPGYVDIGDQGVNDARWFEAEAILVTASGTGSVTMWDPNLGQPCVQQIASHSRCINTVAVSPKDQFICTGGDDQKVVLYQNVRQESRPCWRLTHPLTEDLLPATRPES